MQLILSSTALPAASVQTLRRAAQRRDLTALELVVGTDHAPAAAEFWGMAPEYTESESQIQGGDPSIRWLVLHGTPSVTEVLYRGRQASLLDAGLLLQNAIPESPLGLPLGLIHGTDPEAARKAATWARMHDASTCWTVDLAMPDLEQVTEVLEITAPTLAHVRLLGSGPEAASAGAGPVGTGAVLKELALDGYSGTVALAPSGNGARAAWRRWLLEGSGWGCGTVAQKKAARDGGFS